MHRRRIIFVAVLAVMLVAASTGTQAASGFADPAFQTQWQAGEAITPNFWGPLANARDGQQEPYKEASGGQRLVQYFDKGRMELTNGTVTNGLLATDLIKGQIQIGDSTFQPKPPPAIPIAGDPDTPGPTYAGLATRGDSLFAPASSKPGSFVTLIAAADGTVTDGGGFAGISLSPAIGGFDGTTQHNVLGLFVDYRARVGLSSIGYAISEPFRANVKVGGTPKDVMIQVFERRVLTYTASNPDAFKVEMGNIGQHYYQWRYPNGAPASGAGTIQVDLKSAVAFRYPPTWTLKPEPNAAATLIGPTPTLKLTVQNETSTASIDTELADYVQAVHNLAAGGITSEATVDQTIGGEPGKVYTFTGKRASDKPSTAGGDPYAVSGEIAIVHHHGKVYTFIFLADTATLPNTDDITGILATVTFQS